MAYVCCIMNPGTKLVRWPTMIHEAGMLVATLPPVLSLPATIKPDPRGRSRRNVHDPRVIEQRGRTERAPLIRRRIIATDVRQPMQSPGPLRLTWPPAVFCQTSRRSRKCRRPTSSLAHAPWLCTVGATIGCDLLRLLASGDYTNHRDSSRTSQPSIEDQRR